MNTVATAPAASGAPIGFIVACKTFFSFKPGQSLLEFKNEIGQLTPKDKEEIRAGLIQQGINVKPLDAA